MVKWILSSFLALVLTSVAFAQAADAPVSTSNVVAGLELPADTTVNYDEGFVAIEARCKGTVKWLVNTPSPVKVKYRTVSANSIILSIPPAQATIVVNAIGLVDGKLTEFARMNVIVNPPPPPPQAPPTITPHNTTPVAGVLHFTFVLDQNGVTPEQYALLNSQAIQEAIKAKGGIERVYDVNSPIIAKKKLDVYLQKLNSSNMFIVQRDDGNVIKFVTVPTTEAEVLKIINQVK